MRERPEPRLVSVQVLKSQHDLAQAQIKEKYSRPAPPAQATPEPARPISRPVTWTQGKLPGDVFVKTNSATGAFVVISRAEWERLGR